MNYNISHNRKFEELDAALSADSALLYSQANGGRSLLFVYPPHEETLYIEEAKRRYGSWFAFIDARAIFISFIDGMGVDNFLSNYKEFGDELFDDKDQYDDPTYLKLLTEQIKNSIEEGKTPALIHTGALYGTNFGNINLMEHPVVMKSPIPFVVFYPGMDEQGNILFLNKQIASKYRCLIIR